MCYSFDDNIRVQKGIVISPSQLFQFFAVSKTGDLCRDGSGTVRPGPINAHMLTTVKDILRKVRSKYQVHTYYAGHLTMCSMMSINDDHP